MEGKDFKTLFLIKSNPRLFRFDLVELSPKFYKYSLTFKSTFIVNYSRESTPSATLEGPPVFLNTEQKASSLF